MTRPSGDGLTHVYILGWIRPLMYRSFLCFPVCLTGLPQQFPQRFVHCLYSHFQFTPSTGYEPCATRAHLVVLSLQDLEDYTPRSKRSSFASLSVDSAFDDLKCQKH